MDKIKIKIGDNEYQPPFDSGKMNEYEEAVFDEVGDIVSIEEIVAALNELSALRQERDANNCITVSMLGSEAVLSRDQVEHIIKISGQIEIERNALRQERDGLVKERDELMEENRQLANEDYKRHGRATTPGGEG